MQCHFRVAQMLGTRSERFDNKKNGQRGQVHIRFNLADSSSLFRLVSFQH